MALRRTATAADGSPADEGCALVTSIVVPPPGTIRSESILRVRHRQLDALDNLAVAAAPSGLASANASDDQQVDRSAPNLCLKCNISASTPAWGPPRSTVGWPPTNVARQREEAPM